MNSLIRFKLALTEQIPVIKPYFEDRWAELSDTKIFHVESSLKILEGLHERWVHLLNSLSDEDLERKFEHPETGELISLKMNIGIYAWHCEHHLAHIKNAKLV
jgi:GTP cyclohydrolase I